MRRDARPRTRARRTHVHAPSPARGRGFAYHGFRRRIGRSACGRGKDRQTDVATNRRNGKAGIIVVAGPDAPEDEAERIAARVGAPLVADGEASDEGGPLTLRIDARGLALVGDGLALLPDLSEAIPRLKPGRLRQELLVRAAKVRGAEAPTAIDCTAGLGEDALLLAAAGFSVRLFERNPVVAALLSDELRRAATVPELAEAVGRMEFVEGGSVAALGSLPEPPDVVYLDPMFPARRKSAAVKKKFQLIHRLEQPCEDAEALLRAAFAARPRKIVVKRPPKGPHLCDEKPSYSIEGKAVRYDCYALARP